MVKKQSIRKRMKPVINALRGGKKTWSDLVKLDIPEKTLDRILKDYLKYWDLAKKEGNYWVWYEHSRFFKSKHDYDLAIEHSRKLLPAFQNMLEVALVDRHPLYSYAKEHLGFYPEIYKKLEKLEELFSDRVRYLFQKYGHRVLTPDRFEVMHFEKRKGKGFFGKLFGESVLVKEDIMLAIDLSKAEPNEIKELHELRDLLASAKTFNERFEIYRELAGDVSLLIRKVEIGLEPLEGKCSLCPKIEIA